MVLACGSGDQIAKPTDCEDEDSGAAAAVPIDAAVQDAAAEADVVTDARGLDAVVRSCTFGVGCDHTAGGFGTFAPFEPVADGSTHRGGAAHVACTMHLTSETSEVLGSGWCASRVRNGGSRHMPRPSDLVARRAHHDFG